MPTLSITKEQLVEMRPCGLAEHLKLFGRRKTMNAKQALAAGVSVPDLLWVAARLGQKHLCVRFALACAQRVAHLNPDPRVQAALDATQAWLDNPTASAANAAANAAIANAANAAAAIAAIANTANAAAANAAIANAANAAAAIAAIANTANAAAYAAIAAIANTANAVAASAAASAAYAARASGDAATEREAQRAVFIEIFCTEGD